MKYPQQCTSSEPGSEGADHRERAAFCCRCSCVRSIRPAGSLYARSPRSSAGPGPTSPWSSPPRSTSR
eukprot:3326503-Rhodomonas_salina.1